MTHLQACQVFINDNCPIRITKKIHETSRDVLLLFSFLPTKFKSGKFLDVKLNRLMFVSERPSTLVIKGLVLKHFEITERLEQP
jgi:NAD(P)H-flavin reductase